MCPKIDTRELEATIGHPTLLYDQDQMDKYVKPHKKEPASTFYTSIAIRKIHRNDIGRRKGHLI